jgi:hypothetical protein
MPWAREFENDNTNAAIHQEPRKIAQQPLGEFFSFGFRRRSVIIIVGPALHVMSVANSHAVKV